MLCNTPNKQSNFRTKHWVEINDDRNGTYDIWWQKWYIKTTMLNTRLCDYGDAYIIVEGRITVIGQGSDAAEIAGESF